MKHPYHLHLEGTDEKGSIMLDKDIDVTLAKHITLDTMLYEPKKPKQETPQEGQDGEGI